MSETTSTENITEAPQTDEARGMTSGAHRRRAAEWVARAEELYARAGLDGPDESTDQPEHLVRAASIAGGLAQAHATISLSAATAAQVRENSRFRGLIMDL